MCDDLLFMWRTSSKIISVSAEPRKRFGWQLRWNGSRTRSLLPPNLIQLKLAVTDKATNLEHQLKRLSACLKANSIFRLEPFSFYFSFPSSLPSSPPTKRHKRFFFPEIGSFESNSDYFTFGSLDEGHFPKSGAKLTTAHNENPIFYNFFSNG